MKGKLIMALLLTLAIALIPVTGVMASTTILDGTASVTNSEPISITLVSGDGSYDPVTHAWTVSTVGGGTLHLVLKATNNSTTSGYTVSAVVLPTGSPVGVTAAFSPATKYIAAGTDYDFTLTVTVAADAPLTTNGYTFSFTR
jgi:hypothetical protein